VVSNPRLGLAHWHSFAGWLVCRVRVRVDEQSEAKPRIASKEDVAERGEQVLSMLSGQQKVSLSSSACSFQFYRPGEAQPRPNGQVTCAYLDA
jgi:hypothetical protein